MKIDLHCHTKKCKQGDGAEREVSPNDFAEIMRDAEVGIAGITNHNCFDLDQFKNLVEASKDICQVWPGVEFDIASEERDWHLIVICDPEICEEFSTLVETITQDMSPDQVMLDLEEVIRTFDSLNPIYIPHGHGKRSGHNDRSIPKAAEEQLQKLTSNSNRIIHEPTHHSLGVLSRNGYRVILGSDVKDWSKYDPSKLLDLRFPIASYAAFTKLVEGDVDTYNSFVKADGAELELTIRPVKDAKQQVVNLIRGMNILFGQKGTGKTKLIEAVEVDLKGRGIKAKLYKSGNARNDYDDEMTPDRSLCAAETVGASDCTSEFQTILQWEEEPIISLEDTYIRYHKAAITNRNRRRLAMADISNRITFDKETNLQETKEDLSYIQQAKTAIQKAHLNRYLSTEDMKTLGKMLDQAENKARQRTVQMLIEKISIKLCSFSIDSVKKHAERLCDSPSAPNGAGFLDFARNRLALAKACSTILENINGQDHSYSELFGVLSDKGTILKTTRYLMLGENDNPADYYARQKTLLEDARKKIKAIGKSAFLPIISDKVDEAKSYLREKSIDSTDCFVGVKCFTILKNGKQKYVPSDGELAIIMLDRYLAEDHEFYLLDEPERGLGNSYVDSEIRPKLIALARSGKTVLIATHNANLAVRTEPVHSILLEYHGENEFTLYSGSPFSNQLSRATNANDTRNWCEESMNILEGGPEAFYDRKDMYELQ